MRRARVVTWASSLFLFAAGVHCGSDDTSPEAGGPGPGDPIAVPEGGSTTDARDADPIGPTTCSPGGWCETTLPDDDLVFKSIWPLERRAFATVESPTLGFKVLEWDIEDGQWKYIDDNRQNQDRRTKYISNIWAPSDNEIYYAISKGTIVHGTRPAPGQSWTWAFTLLEDHSPARPQQFYGERDYPPQAIARGSYPTLGVWGTSADNVYAWYINTVFHWTTKGGGAPSWVAEYTADDLDTDPSRSSEELFALGATGSGPDDMWFSFVRTDMQWDQGSCPVIVRKTMAGYQRISDGFIVPPPPDAFGSIGPWVCRGPRAGLLAFETQRGWLTPLEAIGNGQVAGILGGRQLVKITANGAGYAVATSTILSFPRYTTPFFGSLYGAPDERLWIAGTGPSGNGGIVVGTDAPWPAGDAGPGYEVSSATLTGAPLEGNNYQVRGTSNTNLWLVGTHHALHKTKL